MTINEMRLQALRREVEAGALTPLEILNAIGFDFCVGVWVEGGIVQDVRANVPCIVVISDADDMEAEGWAKDDIDQAYAVFKDSLTACYPGDYKPLYNGQE